jgi:hypothetical protein
MNLFPKNDTAPNPFEVSRRRTRRRFLIGVTAIVVVVAGVVTYVTLANPARVLRAARPELESKKVRYCKVFEAEKLRGKAPSAGNARAGEPIRETSLSFYEEREPAPFGNAEAIEPQQLEELCAGRPPSTGQVVNAQLPWMFEEPKTGTLFKRKAAIRAVAGMKEVRYLVVVSVDSFRASTLNGAEGLSPGGYAGSAAIYRLEDTTCLGAVTVRGRDAPAAMVAGRLDRSGHVRTEDADADLRFQSKKHFERAVEEAFGAQGLELKLGL